MRREYKVILDIALCIFIAISCLQVGLVFGQDADSLFNQGKDYLRRGFRNDAYRAFGESFQQDPSEDRARNISNEFLRSSLYYASKVYALEAVNLAQDDRTREENHNEFLYVDLLEEIEGDQVRKLDRQYAKSKLDAFGLDPNAELAFDAAQKFEAERDFERAVSMYREVIDEGTHADLTDKAMDFLRARNLDPQPKFSYVRNVDRSYTYPQNSLGDNEKYREEIRPVHPVFDSVLNYAWQTVGGPSSEAIRMRGYTGNGEALNWQKLNVKGFRQYAQKQLAMDEAKADKLLSQIVSDFVDRGLLTPGDMQEIKNRSGIQTPFEYSAVADRDEMHRIARFTVQYLKSTEEREPFEIEFEDGKVSWRGGENSVADPIPLDTSNMSTAFHGKGRAIYVMNPDGQMFAYNHEVSRFHHSSFLAGAPIAAAGELETDPNGVITVLTNKSGHYRPKPVHLAQALKNLEDNGVDLTGIQVELLGVSAYDDPDSTPTKWKGGAKNFLDTFQNQPAEFARRFRDECEFTNKAYEGVSRSDLVDGKFDFNKSGKRHNLETASQEEANRSSSDSNKQNRNSTSSKLKKKSKKGKKR